MLSLLALTFRLEPSSAFLRLLSFFAASQAERVEVDRLRGLVDLLRKRCDELESLAESSARALRNERARAVELERRAESAGVGKRPAKPSTPGSEKVGQLEYIPISGVDVFRIVILSVVEFCSLTCFLFAAKVTMLLDRLNQSSDELEQMKASFERQIGLNEKEIKGLSEKLERVEHHFDNATATMRQVDA
jgi:hypothetical protein